MSDATESLIRYFAFLFPGIRIEQQGGWRIVRQATAEERQRWGW